MRLCAIALDNQRYGRRVGLRRGIPCPHISDGEEADRIVVRMIASWAGSMYAGDSGDLLDNLDVDCDTPGFI